MMMFLLLNMIVLLKSDLGLFILLPLEQSDFFASECHLPSTEAKRLCQKTRSGFERLVSRLTTFGCIDDKANEARVIVKPSAISHN